MAWCPSEFQILALEYIRKPSAVPPTEGTEGTRKIKIENLRNIDDFEPTFKESGQIGITIFSGSLYAVCFFPPVVFGLYGRVASANITLVSMILGMSTLVLWITLGLSALLPEVFPALLVSASVYWLQSSKETAAEV